MSGANALRRLRAELSVGLPPTDMAGVPDRAAAAVRLAVEVGAPALAALDAATEAERAVSEQHRRLRAATAQSRVVVAGLALLPMLAIPGLQAIVGLPLLAFYGTPAGRSVGVAGAVLGLAGVGSARWLVRRTARLGEPSDVDELADLVAIAIGAGLPVGQALRLVAERRPGPAAALRRHAYAHERGLAVDTPIAEVVDVAAIAHRIGAPAAAALRDLARAERAERLGDAAVAAERLPVLLTFPTALCLLPAAVLLVGAPLVAVGLGAAAGT